MKSIDTSLIFQPTRAPARLTQLLADFVPRTAKQIAQEIKISNLPKTAQRANESLKPYGFEIQAQLHPRQKHWFWLMTEIGGRNYAG